MRQEKQAADAVPIRHFRERDVGAWFVVASCCPHPSSSGGLAMAVSIGPPTNPMVNSLLTDMYQISMAYAYWKAGKQDDYAVFDLLHRKNPFGGEYTVFAGLEECIRFAANFRFTSEELKYLRSVMPAYCEDDFFAYLAEVDCRDVRIFAVPEGSVVFPRVPLIRVEGPLLASQLLETTFLTLVNYASLVATNAARHRQVAGEDKLLLEFGLRRAQGPDGGISASRYCYVGGFDGTSNVEAGRRFGIPVRGTHSHAFIGSYMGFDEIVQRTLVSSDGSRTCQDFPALAQQWLEKMQAVEGLRARFLFTNTSELAAFCAYALAFPDAFQALVDTYDVLRSGIPNFCAVALALWELGYHAVGIRLDSGDLAYQSVEARKFFSTCDTAFNADAFTRVIITASNDINEETLDALNKQGHSVDAFGIGTHLVTCFKQPALGCVFKLVEINGQPRIKLSQDIEKVTIPGKKKAYRIYGREGYALLDIMLGQKETPPKVGERILCRHPFSESRRAYVVPARVETLLHCYWDGLAHTHTHTHTQAAAAVAAAAQQQDKAPVEALEEGPIMPPAKDKSGAYHLPSSPPPPLPAPSARAGAPSQSSSSLSVDGRVRWSRETVAVTALPPLEDVRRRCREQIRALRPDHKRGLNPTPYKVSVSDTLYNFLHFQWLSEAPVGELV